MDEFRGIFLNVVRSSWDAVQATSALSAADVVVQVYPLFLPFVLIFFFR